MAKQPACQKIGKRRGSKLRAITARQLTAVRLPDMHVVNPTRLNESERVPNRAEAAQ